MKTDIRVIPQQIVSGYYIQPMNPVLLGEQETRTIKYLNKSHQLEDQCSQSLTEKQYEQEMLPPRKKHPPRQQQPQLYIDTRPHRTKIVVIQPLEQPPIASLPSRNLANQNKNKHKKGKSVDIEEANGHVKEQKKGHNICYDSETKGKIVINNDFLNGFRERGSISEMKQYNFSKKLTTVKKSKEQVKSQPRKKKAKSINQGEIRQIKKQIRSIMETAPLQLNMKKKEGSKSSCKSSRSSSNNAFYPKHIKNSKSHQLNTDRKTHKSKTTLSQLKHIAYTMPITSKMVSLYSNTSSLFSSKAELDKVQRRHSYVIPTEESIQEIPQIRQYESLSLRKRSSDNLRKASLIHELSQQDPQQSTAHIISNYIELLQSHQIQFQRQIAADLQLSAIPHQNSFKERNEQMLNSDMIGSLNLAELHQVNKNGLVLDQSQVMNPLSKQIDQQEQQLDKLNHIISIIQRKNDKEVNKQQILQQIKCLIANNSQHPKQEERHQSPPVARPQPILLKETKFDQVQNKNDLSSSQLRQSLNLQQSMEGLNLQILDKTLRERQNYLVQRKERQLQRLQEQCVRRDETWKQERDKISKWMDHQIKQVVRTRKQLWKGFHIAKNLLQQDAQQENRKNEMIRCLSDKYLAKSHRKSKKPSTELSRGRVNEIQAKSDHKHSEQSGSDVHIDIKGDSDDEDEQLLDSSSKLKNDFEQYKKSLPEPKVDFEHEVSSESMDSSSSNPKLQESPKLLQPPSLSVPSVGLNLQPIECEVDYEDSLNSQEIDALAKQSEHAKSQSLRLPYTLALEDKEDIFQFIFLDLCIQLTDEYLPDSHIMQKIASFIRNMKEQARKQKGFKTNTNAIRDYLFQFITYLKNKPDQLAEVHLNIDKPLGPTALDILKYMHVYDEDPPEEEGGDTVFILDIKLFQGFEQAFLANLQFEKYYEQEEKQKKRRVFLKNAIHIHNKAIFDALNETLDRQRPFGVWGEPFSWKKAAKFYHTRDVASKNSLILRSAQRTIEYGAYMCGFIADKQDCNLRNNPNVTQTYIDQIRDDRLSRLLANQLEESEQKMLFIDDEQTEILVEVAQAILHNLLVEACRELL